MAKTFEELEALASANKSRQCKRGPLTIELRDEPSRFANHLHYFWDGEELNRVQARTQYLSRL